MEMRKIIKEIIPIVTYSRERKYYLMLLFKEIKLFLNVKCERPPILSSEYTCDYDDPAMQLCLDFPSLSL